MVNQNIIKVLQDYFPSTPVEKAWLFGSYARGEETADSDIDILYYVDRTKVKKFSLLDYAQIIVDLEKRLYKKVDFVTDGYLIPRAGKTANKDKILIYEKCES
ncbi:MAG: nucleotidyltransferase domain-containing protein [Bacteroidales bacterium]|jgi:predicted nucleotidyltransferase|nr:nucleotidyltransferase domain-containing protein [Bacteroidales bacterium]